MYFFSSTLSSCTYVMFWYQFFKQKDSRLFDSKLRKKTSITYLKVKGQILKEFCCWWKKLGGSVVKEN